jgi:hypothetical protein
MNSWHLLILSLPTTHSAARQRAWRALKASGAAILRDGVYLLPAQPQCQQSLQDIAAEVKAGDGSAWLFTLDAPEQTDFTTLFDRTTDYSTLLADIAALQLALTPANAHDTLKQLRKLSKAFTTLGEIDYFPSPLRQQTATALLTLTTEANQSLSPEEPQAVVQTVQQLDKNNYQRRIWATRQRPWVDRLASAWLIKRFIDPKATIRWLPTPHDCPADALGFDFDGATFSHVGNWVTFEVLLRSFDLHDPALGRIASIVHYLDVGGIPVAEASGVETILAGLRQQILDDNTLLQQTMSVFDGLLAAFAKTHTPATNPVTGKPND